MSSIFLRPRRFPWSLTVLGPAILTLSALAAVPVAAQGLSGQLVQVSKLLPTKSTVDASIPAKIINPGGTTFLGPESGTDGNFKFVSTTVTPTQIQITLIPPGAGVLSYGIGFGSSGSPDFYAGIRVSEVGSLPIEITGVSVDPITHISDAFAPPETFDISRVTFDAHNVYLNFNDLFMDNKSNVTLNFTTAPAAVPEASTTVSLGLLLALGAGGLVITVRRKKSPDQV